MLEILQILQHDTYVSPITKITNKKLSNMHYLALIKSIYTGQNTKEK